jgi:hypothetical protein
MRLATLTLAAVALALSVAGCGEEVIDAERVEAVIRTTPDLKVPIAAADCPADVAVKDGATFECKVRYENGSEEAWQSATKPLEDVDCPEGIKIESGATFECVARFRDGSKSAVTILQRDDLGNVEVSSARSVK